MREPAREIDGAVSGDAGMALLTVLWFVALMSALAVTLVDLGRDTAYATRNAVQAVASRAGMAGAVAIAAESLRLDRFPSSGVLSWRQGGQRVQVRALPESGKIDLNAASDELIEALARVAASDAEAALPLAHAILDWRDPGSERRLAGAEASEYAAVGRRARPRNGPFPFVAELRSVLGVDAATYHRLAPNVTVHHGEALPAGAGVTPLVRRAMDRLAAIEDGEAVGENPFEAPAETLEVGGVDSPALAFAPDPAGLYTLEIELAADDGPTFRQQTVIWIDPPLGTEHFAVLQNQSVVLPAPVAAPAVAEVPWPGR